MVGAYSAHSGPCLEVRLTIGAHMGMSHNGKGRREGSTEGEIELAAVR